MKTRIIKQIKLNKTNARVAFSDDSYIKINKNIVEDFRLYINKEINESIIKEIKEASSFEDLFQKTLKKIKVKDFSSGKLRDYLKKQKVNNKKIDIILNRLNAASLLNDQAILSSFLSYADYKHYGFNKIIKKLYESGVSPYLIKEVHYSDERERKEIILLIKNIEHKFKNCNYVTKKKKIYCLCVREGFDTTLTFEIINKIIKQDKKHELNVLKLDYLKLLERNSNNFKDDNSSEKIKQTLLRKGYNIEDINYLEGNLNEMD